MGKLNAIMSRNSTDGCGGISMDTHLTGIESITSSCQAGSSIVQGSNAQTFKVQVDNVDGWSEQENLNTS